MASAEFYDATSGCAYALALQILQKPELAEDVVFLAYSRLWSRPAELGSPHDMFSELVLLVRRFALARRTTGNWWRNFWFRPVTEIARWLGMHLKRRANVSRLVFPR